MKTRLAIVAFVLVFLTIAACKPATTPAPATTPQATAPAPFTAPGTTPAISAYDAAWQKVIDAAKKEGSVTMYSFNFGGDVGLAVNKAFKDKYGIKLDIITGRGAEQLERLKAERRMGTMVADLMDGSRVHAANVKKDGLTVNLADLPFFKDKQVWTLNPFVLDEGGHVLAFSYFVYAPFINPTMVKAGEQP